MRMRKSRRGLTYVSAKLTINVKVSRSFYDPVIFRNPAYKGPRAHTRPIMSRRRADSFPLASLSLKWLVNLTRVANRPDENLGQADIGRSLCRVTTSAAEKLMDEFRHIDSCYGRKPDTFIDLGCGRGLVCASAMLLVPELSQVIGWDINEREIAWARNHVIEGAELALRTKASFEVGNATGFTLGIDVVCVKDLNVGVWVYAFWKDWGYDRQLLARRMFLEQSDLWTVFACSDNKKMLFDLIAGEDQELKEELASKFNMVGCTSVRLAGSGEKHSIYFYAKHPGKTFVTEEQLAANPWK
jgi:hypothetical protein